MCADTIIVTVDIVMMVVVAIKVGLFAEPALDVETLGPGILEASVEHRIWMKRTHDRAMDRRAWIYAPEASFEIGNLIGAYEVGFCHNDAVGDRRLLDRLGLPIKLARGIDRIYSCYNAI